MKERGNVIYYLDTGQRDKSIEQNLLIGLLRERLQCRGGHILQ